MRVPHTQGGARVLVSSVGPAEVGCVPVTVGPPGCLLPWALREPLRGPCTCGGSTPAQVCGLGQAHLFPIDVARGYGDHGGFSHEPRQEGAHAQSGSVYPGDENTKATGLLKPCRGTGRAETQRKPRKGADKRGTNCPPALRVKAAPDTRPPPHMGRGTGAPR